MPKYSLPVFEELTQDFDRAFSHQVAMATRGDGLLAKIDAHTIHEGKSSTFVTQEGRQRTMVLRVAEASATIPNPELDKINEERVMHAIRDLADQFKNEQYRQLFNVLAEATSETGNVVDGKGKPLSNELVLETLEKMQHDFDENGEPTMSIVVHPDMAPRLIQLQTDFENNPELRKRHSDIMLRKWDEFRSREMDRNLAG
jgi:hypothetical protein